MSECCFRAGPFKKLIILQACPVLLSHQSSRHSCVALFPVTCLNLTNLFSLIPLLTHSIQTFEDYWVYERPFYKSLVFKKAGPWGANWRLLAQLDVQVRFGSEVVFIVIFFAGLLTGKQESTDLCTYKHDLISVLA